MSFNHRSMSLSKSSQPSGSSFQDWLEDQRQGPSDTPSAALNDVFSSFQSIQGLEMFKQVYSLQEQLGNQLQELSGSLPDAGPLSAAFRQRAMHAIYLLFAAIVFGLLAVFIGLPTLIFRPAKFVVCMTLATLSAAGSVIVLQKPSVFLATVMKGDLESTGPVLALFASLLATIYATLIIHRYLHVIVCGALQIFCLLYYLASYIPGGTTGLLVLVKTGYYLLGTILKPFIFLCRKSAEAAMRRVFS